MTPPDAGLTVDSLLLRRQWLRRLALSLAHGDAAAADDLEQEAWLAVLRSPPRSETGVRAWFRSVMRNRVVQDARSAQRRRTREEATAPEEARPSAAEVVARAEAHRRVVLAVFELEEPLRTTVLLRYFEDLPPEEIGRRMGVPGNTVRARLRRALAVLRRALAPEEGKGVAPWLLLLALPSAVGDGAASGTTGGAVLGGALVGAGKAMPVVGAVLALAAIGYLLLRGEDAPDGLAGSGTGRETASLVGSGGGAGGGTEGRGGASDDPDGTAATALVPGGAALRGEVLLADTGAPAADVEVRLAGAGAGGGPRTVRTGAAGRFSFEGLPGGGPYSVEASAAGMATARRSGLLLGADETRFLEPLLLGAPLRVRVTVLGPEAEPVAGAVVSAFPGRKALSAQDWTGRGETAAARVTTGEAGTASFDDLAPGVWSFRAEGDGFATAGVPRKPLLRGGATVELVLVLEQGFPLQGTVHAPDGAPLVGVPVLALTPLEGQAAAKPSLVDPLREEVLTDEKGRYSFPALRRGTHSIALSLGGGLPARVGIVDVPRVSVFDVHLDGGEMAGLVTEEGTGAAVAGARVRVAVWRRHHATWLEAVTGADGRYSMNVPLAGLVHPPSDADPSLRRAPVNLTVEKEGYVLMPGSRPTLFNAGFVGGPTPLEWNFTLRRGASLEGVVRGPSGPVAGAAVTAETWNAVAGSTTDTTVADGEGRYRFHALPEGTARLVVVHPGLVQSASPGTGWGSGTPPADGATVAIPRTGAATLDLEMREGAAVVGLVRGPAGPVSGALVRAEGEDGAVSETSTGDDGVFRVDGLRPGTTASLAVSADGFASARRTVVADGAEGAEPLRIDLAAAGRLSGRVLGPDGAPVPGAVVQIASAKTALEERYEIRDVWHDAPRMPADREGRFTVDVPGDLAGADATVVLRASATGHAPVLTGALAVADGAHLEGLVLDLRTGHRLEGRVVDRADGSPVAGVRIEFANADLPPELGQGRDWSRTSLNNHPFEFVAVTGADGGFVVEDLPPFAYRLRVGSSTHTWVYADAPVPAEAPLTVTVDALVSLSGTVAYEDGTPAAGAQLMARSEPGGRPFGSAVAEADGSFTIPNLLAGTYRLEASSPPQMAVDVRRTLGPPVEAPGEGVRMTVTRGAGTISGRCVGPGGVGVPRAQVFAKPATGGMAAPGTLVYVLSGPDGSFTLAGLEPGSYALGGVAARAAGGPETAGQPLAAELPAVPVGVTGVELRFERSRSLTGRVVEPEEGGSRRSIVVQARRGRESLWVRMAGVGPDGAFAFNGLPPGAYILIACDAATGTPVPGCPEVEAEAGSGEVRIVLPKG